MVHDANTFPSDAQQPRIEDTCERYEAAWKQGLSPRIEDYVSGYTGEDLAHVLQALQLKQRQLIIGSDNVFRVGASTNQILSSNISNSSSDLANTASLDLVAAASTPNSQLAQVTFNVISGPHQGLGFSFNSYDTLFAGRLSKAQLRLENDLHFSRHHFRLEVNPPSCFLMDLNSTNGTFVNGERVTDRFLRDGDIVSGGRTKMIVSIFDPAATLSNKSVGTNFQPYPVITAQTTELSERDDSGNDEPVPEINGYRVYEQIGSGDLGIVYRAKKNGAAGNCALKILTPSGHVGESSIKSFLREASLLKELRHPHIIRFLELGVAEHNIFLATEYVHSISWHRLVEEQPAEKRIRIACGLMMQILAALDYAHQRSLVHRDVKPGNVLIARHEGRLSAKLADFGLAKRYTSAGMSQVTRDGAVLGSLPYMSPDQFLNAREARPSCDLYSAGATLYWMLTGKEPILVEGHPCKFLAILEAAPTPIRHHNRLIPLKLAELVHRALEKKPEMRFTSAAQMRNELRHFVKK